MVDANVGHPSIKEFLRRRWLERRRQFHGHQSTSAVDEKNLPTIATPSWLRSTSVEIGEGGVRFHIGGRW